MTALKLIVRSAENLNLRSASGVTSKFKSAHFDVAAAFTDGDGNPVSGRGKRSKDWAAKSKSSKARKADDNETRGECHWGGDVIELEYDPEWISAESCVEIALRRDYGGLTASEEKGRTRVTLGDLAEMDDNGDGVELMMFLMGRFDNINDSGNLVSAGSDALPTILRVSVDRTTLPECVASAAEPGGKETQGTFAKRIMIVTRGTRGDVQPFVALARGLAEVENWDVTIVTELGYKAKLKKQTSDVDAGIIRFRPSGGDTMKKVSSEISQTAINLKINAQQTNAMQKIFLARSEVEFFGSEPAVYYWAKKERPDYLMFGFTMATVTLTVSEALGIPVLGFVLQPTSIPSSQYPPILPLQEATLKKMTQDCVDSKHDHFKMLKYLMDNVGGDKNINSKSSLRKRRGLEEYKSYKTSTWQELKDKNFPLIVPINETMFGGKPADWSENSIFTDCIFLRGGAVPPIADDAITFIDGVRAMDGGKIVVLAFSSMPVSKTNIVSIALKIIEECKSKACVFALVGGQMDDPFPDETVKKAAEDAVSSGRLFLASGAPFGRLFSLVDAVVLHGGLGTTSEALQAKVPAIVTGVLLLDQRFWGSRCKEMGVGPFGVHVDDFPDVCVEYVDKALEDGSAWRENASKIGSILIEQAGDDPSGVRRNVECVVRMSERAKPYYYHRAQDDSVQMSTVDVGKQLLKESLEGLRKEKQEQDKDTLCSDEVYVQAV